jgi:hypothetical protein
MEATSFLRQNKTLDPPHPPNERLWNVSHQSWYKKGGKDFTVASLLADWLDRRMDADTLILAECLKNQILLLDREILINKFLFQELKKKYFYLSLHSCVFKHLLSPLSELLQCLSMASRTVSQTYGWIKIWGWREFISCSWTRHSSL